MDGINSVKEEAAQKQDIVAIVSMLTNDRPEVSQVVRTLESALQAAYSRGYHDGLAAH